MTISDLTETKTVRRAYTDGFGNRKMGVQEYEVKYNYEIENDSFRILAKIIDLALVAFSMHFMVLNEIISLNLIIYTFPVCFILYNTIMESMLGSSIGKILLNIAVLNEKAENLSFVKSLQRTFLSFLLILLYVIPNIGLHHFWEYLDKKYLDYNIYIIARNKRKEIKQMLHQHLPAILDK